MRMDLAGERFQVEDRYQVELPPGNHLIVVAGAHLGEPAYNFDHPNIAAKKSRLFEFKPKPSRSAVCPVRPTNGRLAPAHKR
jgi:hypothetical protein